MTNIVIFRCSFDREDAHGGLQGGTIYKPTEGGSDQHQATRGLPQGHTGKHTLSTYAYCMCTYFSGIHI